MNSLEMIALRLINGSKEDPLLEAADWLATFFEQSWSISPKYLKPGFVKGILRPLVKQVPYVPANSKNLFRVIGSKKPITVGSNLLLKSNTLYSFTELSKKVDWQDLADQVGANGSDYCYVARLEGKALEMFNYKWALKAVLNYLVKHFDDEPSVKKLEDQRGYTWQKEVVVFSSSEIQTKIVADITY